MLIDTHCHLDFKDFEGDRDEVIKRAASNGVGYIINVGCDIESSLKSIEIADLYENIFASVGIHPHYADGVSDSTWSGIEELAKRDKVVAIGEVGLDYYRSTSGVDAQKDLFRRFIRLAGQTGKPLLIHNREADADILRILNESSGVKVKAVMHCFSQSPDFLSDCLKMGLHISFTCNITFEKASRLREVVALVPLDRLFLETDSPFLAPQSHRGQRNEPSNLTYLVSKISDIRGIDSKEIENRTTMNAMSFFNITSH